MYKPMSHKPTRLTHWGNVSQPEGNWQKGLESQVLHLSGKLSALCSEMKELHQLLFVDDETVNAPISNMTDLD